MGRLVIPPNSTEGDRRSEDLKVESDRGRFGVKSGWFDPVPYSRRSSFFSSLRTTRIGFEISAVSLFTKS